MNNRLNFKFIICITCIISFCSHLRANNIDAKSDKKILSIDESYLQKWDENQKDKKELDKSIYKIDSFSRLKEGQTQFAYYLLDKPIENEVYKTCLIYEYYESEMAVWLVNYSSQDKIIDSLQIYYDNAEGAWQTTSTLNKETKVIRMEEYDAYADPEKKTTMYRILPSGKIEKINN